MTYCLVAASHRNVICPFTLAYSATAQIGFKCQVLRACRHNNKCVITFGYASHECSIWVISQVVTEFGAAICIRQMSCHMFVCLVVHKQNNIFLFCTTRLSTMSFTHHKNQNILSHLVWKDKHIKA